MNFSIEVSLTDCSGIEVATMTFEWSLRARKVA